MKQNINPSLLNGNFKKEDNASSGLRRSFSQGSLASCETNFNPDEIDLKLEEQDKKLEKLESIILSLLTQNEEQRVQLEEQKKLLQEQQANSSSKIMELEGALENAVKSTKDFKDIISAKLQADAIAQQSAIEQRSLTIQADLKRSITSLKQEQEKDKQEISFLHNQELSRFLNLVAWGEEQAAEQMLKKARRLATMAGDLTDPAGREFKHITAFQYAVWALDYHMWTMIRTYLTNEQLKEQLAGLGSSTWLVTNGVHGTQVSWQNLINNLKEHATLGNCAGQDIMKHWCTKVGGEQLKLPAHVINEYMRLDRSFNPCPDFISSVLPRSDINDWYKPLHNRPRGVGRARLGIDVAWSRDGWEECRSGNWADLYCSRNVIAVIPAGVDAIALNKLLEVRLKQSAELKSQVAKLVAPTPRP